MNEYQAKINHNGDAKLLHKIKASGNKRKHADDVHKQVIRAHQAKEHIKQWHHDHNHARGIQTLLSECDSRGVNARELMKQVLDECE